ncbi:MAG: ADP-ribosylglycohydrolase family protein [Desulfobulbus sp.]|nr:ADP-ribosylglycohydrolase family protein [Desulfobulbus sp.]
MTQTTWQDRAQGALMGAFIGDALALGPHWYYDLEEMRRDYGEWISDYTDPKPGRYHEGCKAGQLSQAGYILKLMVESLVKHGEYDHGEFCLHLEDQLFARLDGTHYNGPGGYTSQSIREAWRKREQGRASWEQTGGKADTTEAIERTLALAVRYAKDPAELARTVVQNTLLTQNDDMLVSMTVAYAAVLARLVCGDPFDGSISDTLMQLVKSGELPFHAVTQDNLKPPKPGTLEQSRAGRFASPDALLTPSFIARAAKDPQIAIEPAWKVSLLYGMPCAIYHILPSAYYLAARFNDDFESGVLHAVNGGGQNQARAILTGALCGAQVGIRNIPSRFIDGLEEGTVLMQLTKDLARQADAV